MNIVPASPRNNRLPYTFLFASLVLLVISGLCNVFLFRQAKASYRDLSEVQLDPYSIKRSPGVKDALCIGPSPMLMFFGDSRAKQWPAPNLSGSHVTNCGIVGQTTEQVRGRFDSHVAPIEPRIIVLQAGINDLKAIGVLPHRRDAIVADCKANLREIVQRARRMGAVVIVTTIFPVGDVPLQRKLVWSDEIETAVGEVNAELRQWNAPGVVVVDAWKLLQEGGKLRSDYAVDTLHVNERGYAALNVELRRVITSLPAHVPQGDKSGPAPKTESP